MKKTTVILLLVCLLLGLTMTSCQERTWGDELPEFLLVEAGVIYSVPGLYQSDLRGRSTYVIERDKYGRMLVEVSWVNDLTEETETAYVILQECVCTYGTTSADHVRSYPMVYFYEDQNYLRTMEESMDKKAIAALKVQNDWDRPLERAKMSSRRVSATYERTTLRDGLPYVSGQLEEALKRDCGFATTDIRCRYFSGWDGVSHELYIIHLYSGESYLAIRDKDNRMTHAQIEDRSDVGEMLVALKKEAGWEGYPEGYFDRYFNGNETESGGETESE